jgi:hypothetical protein
LQFFTAPNPEIDGLLIGGGFDPCLLPSFSSVVSRDWKMIRKLLAWSLDNPLIVLALCLGLIGYGGYAFKNVNVEAYPDPAPAIIEVIAQYPGASAEEVERQVTVPLEVTLAGMPKLKVPSHQVPVWIGARTPPIRVWIRLQGSAPGSDQPVAIRSATAAWRQSPAIAAKSNRRDLSVYPP